jgi:hypothetical protein
LNSGAISWKAKKQTIVATSSTEAEYIALENSTKEALWLRKLQEDLNNENPPPIVIYQDNQSTMCLANNPVHNDRSKHIDVKTHAVRDRISRGLVSLVYCPTELMTADILTKGLQRIAHQRHSCGLGMRN